MRTRRGLLTLLATLSVAAAGCGDNGMELLQPGIDAAVATPDGPVAVCGNSEIEGSEQCDDGNMVDDDACNNHCRLTCGDGVVGGSELCDTAIAAGQPGACPTTCDDGMPCTADTLTGTACQAHCTHADITAYVNGDTCCPPGGNHNNDTDCPVTCGNGVVEAGETCDTAITSGTGKCPTACDDGVACTTDTLNMGGTCAAYCTNTPITQPHDNDGCCPAGANHSNDNDCQLGCGDGVVSPGETCDIAIPTGPGSCPTSCNDNNACTTDALLNGGTCSAACTHTTITATVNGDGCCPAGANHNTDTDCTPRCGNGIIEGPTENCDDGNMTSGDGCSSTCQQEVTGMRMSSLLLRDPHIFVDFLACNDVTDNALFTFKGVNPTITDNLTKDADANGFLDLSPVLVFKPIKQGGTLSTPVDLVFAGCTAPQSSTMCSPRGGARYAATATNQTSGMCLDKLAGTTRASYTPSWSGTAAPCFSTDAQTITVTLSGIPITLTDARVAAVYSGNPATGLVNGLLRGFISETDANNTLLPASLPLIGGQPLSSVLPGGTNACPSFDDRDYGPGNVHGWYFYLNFTAQVAPWSETP